MANISSVRGSAQESTHAPRSPRRFAERLWTVARLTLCAMAISAVSLPAIMDDSPSAAPPMRLVDDGGSSDDGSPDPPYNPTPSPSNGSQSPGGDDGEDPPGGDKDEPGSAAGTGGFGLPVAAQAGISLGVIGLAALALLPGRRPPASLRG